MVIRLSSAALAALTLFTTVRVTASGVTSDSSGVNGQTYDYIVVGGGLTGVTVAARLAENSALKVLLVEAGGDDRTNPQVYDLYKYGQSYDGPMDWAWPTDQGKVIHGSVFEVSSSARIGLTQCIEARRLVAAPLLTVAHGPGG